MDLIQLIILALIQGVTEFLPISSSAHLILLPRLTEWHDQGLAIDVAAHFGSLFAVMFYFRKDIAHILIAGKESIVQRKIVSHAGQLFCLLAITCIPVLISGFLLSDFISDYLRDPVIIALASIGFGLLLGYADVKGKQIRSIKSVNIRDAMIIGFVQVLALIPGTSRSGVTITAALILGFDRNSAARFSFLMSIPVILAAASHESLKIIISGVDVHLVDFIITAVLSAISAFLTIHYFLQFLNKIGMLPFVIYRVVFGIVSIMLFL